MQTLFEPIAHSWVARHPQPIGVVEFIGGALYGLVPHLAYAYFLDCLYQAGYTVIAVPVQPGFDHQTIAQNLLLERDQIRTLLHYPPNMPHVWVGHSLGCKYITLLEVSGEIIDQPSLLLAPDISDTSDALPIPALADLLDRLHLGAKPTRKETQTMVRASSLFNLTALISFEDDRIAGNQSGSIDQSDVAWFLQELQSKQGSQIFWREILGEHREPIGIRSGSSIIRPNLTHPVISISQRQLESLAIDLLSKLLFYVKGAIV